MSSSYCDPEKQVAGPFMQKSDPLFTLNGVNVAEQIEEVFKFWVTTFGKRSSTALDDARKKKLQVALKHYSVEECKQAIKGCSLSPWHSGHNPNNKKYHELTLIFRNADKIETFIDIYETETSAETTLNEWLNDSN